MLVHIMFDLVLLAFNISSFQTIDDANYMCLFDCVIFWVFSLGFNIYNMYLYICMYNICIIDFKIRSNEYIVYSKSSSLALLE